LNQLEVSTILARSPHHSSLYPSFSPSPDRTAGHVALIHPRCVFRQCSCLSCSRHVSKVDPRLNHIQAPYTRQPKFPRVIHRLAHVRLSFSILSLQYNTPCNLKEALSQGPCDLSNFTIRAFSRAFVAGTRDTW
jgi:hypothetical protein